MIDTSIIYIVECAIKSQQIYLILALEIEFKHDYTTKDMLINFKRVKLAIFIILIIKPQYQCLACWNMSISFFREKKSSQNNDKMTNIELIIFWYLFYLQLIWSGIFMGTLTMEMGGKVTISCPKTSYHCDLEFKLKVGK